MTAPAQGPTAAVSLPEFLSTTGVGTLFVENRWLIVAQDPISSNRRVSA